MREFVIAIIYEACIHIVTYLMNSVKSRTSNGAGIYFIFLNNEMKNLPIGN